MSDIYTIKFNFDESLKNIEFNSIETNNLLIQSTNVPSNTDLIPGKYEGGLKVWECSIDLLNFLQKKYSKNTTNLKVLELGCGHGFPGIYMLLKNCDVLFNDFNKEVLNEITLKYIKNLEDKYSINLEGKYSFIDGDWGDFRSDKKFDLILSADTLYNPGNYEKLYNILKNYLNKDGVAYFSTKKFYFGVGGSASQFMEFVREKGELEANKILEINNGISNMRNIIEITWKK